MTGNWITFDPCDRSFLPRVPAVYVILFKGIVVYVGSTVDLRARFSAGHIFRYQGYTNLMPMKTPWSEWEYGVTAKYSPSKKLGDWAMREIRLIDRLQPKYNVRGIKRKEGVA